MNSEVLSKDYQCPNAPKCSGAYRSKGCDGKGKIQGGIATIPFMAWWPIKVYRPCPSYLEAGYVYRREGQTLEQVLFSEPSTKMKEQLEERKRMEMQKKKDSMTAEDTILNSEIDRVVNERLNKDKIHENDV